MYTSSFYATATSHPDPPFTTPFSPNKLPLEYAQSAEFFSEPLPGDEDGRVVISQVWNWLSQTIKLKLEGKKSYDAADRRVMAGMLVGRSEGLIASTS